MDNRPEDDVFLDRCPFCGGEAEISEGTQGGDKPVPWFYVECTGCSASANAVVDWNNRHSSSEADASPGPLDRRDAFGMCAALCPACGQEKK